MSASGTGAVVLSFAGGLAYCTFATAAALRRKGGRLSWRGVAIGYRPRALFFGLLGVALTLNALAVILMEANDRHPAFCIAMISLSLIMTGLVVKTLAEVAVRRRM